MVQLKCYRSKVQRPNTENINKHKKDDITIAQKETKCVHCKQTALNRYEHLHSDGNFYVNNICSLCHKNWS